MAASLRPCDRGHIYNSPSRPAKDHKVQMSSQTMRAAWISRFGGPEVLAVRQVSRPQITREQVLLRVRASALNRADLLQRQGKYPPPPRTGAETPGIECARHV